MENPNIRKHPLFTALKKAGVDDTAAVEAVISVTELDADIATKQDLQKILADYATKQDLQKILADYATKQDLQKILADYATKQDLQKILADYATKQDLSRLEKVMMLTIKTEVTNATNRMIMWSFGSMLGLAAVLVTIIAAFLF